MRGVGTQLLLGHHAHARLVVAQLYLEGAEPHAAPVGGAPFRMQAAVLVAVALEAALEGLAVGPRLLVEDIWPPIRGGSKA